MPPHAFNTTVAEFMADNRPFFFVVDFEKTNPQIYPWEEAKQAGFWFDVKGKTNAPQRPTSPRKTELIVHPISEKEYTLAFDHVKKQRLRRKLLFGQSHLSYPS